MGQQLVETTTGGLHIDHEKIKEIQSNEVSLGDQIIQALTQATTWEEKVRKLDAELQDAMATAMSTGGSGKVPTEYAWKLGAQPSMHAYSGDKEPSADRARATMARLGIRLPPAASAIAEKTNAATTAIITGERRVPPWYRSKCDDRRPYAPEFDTEPSASLEQ